MTPIETPIERRSERAGADLASSGGMGRLLLLLGAIWLVRSFFKRQREQVVRARLRGERLS